MESILIIDDDISLCSMLKEYFALHKMKLAMRHNGLRGLEEARSGKFDLILLDVMLPGIDGFEVLRMLRPISDVSILLLTARSEVDDRINGLENGADDYLAKPFNPRELVARIRSILRRRSATAMDVLVRDDNRRISVRGFELDTATRSARYRGTVLALTETEFALLEALLESPGVVLGREQLSDRISQRPFHPLDRSLDMLISRLRRKLDVQDNPGQAIRTIRSTGYVFMVPERKLSRPQMLNGRALESA
jgi:two-component system response regulator CpxR